MLAPAQFILGSSGSFKVLNCTLQETEKCAVLLKRHALSPFAAPAGLGPTMACCLLAYVHCSAIQASHSIHLTPRLMRDLWPACDQVRLGFSLQKQFWSHWASYWSCRISAAQSDGEALERTLFNDQGHFCPQLTMYGVNEHTFDLACWDWNLARAF